MAIVLEVQEGSEFVGGELGEPLWSENRLISRDHIVTSRDDFADVTVTGILPRRRQGRVARRSRTGSLSPIAERNTEQPTRPRSAIW
jgi:hypothetical protein